MQMISFEKQRAKLAHFNLRSELHGDETKNAVDLKIEMDLPNEILDKFDPDLRSSLYRKPKKNEAKELFDGTDAEVPMRVLRYPKLAPLSWEDSFPGYLLTIAYGPSGTNDLKLDATVDKFRITPKDGGSVLLTFRLVVHPDGMLDLLAGFLNREIEMTLVPPSADANQQQLEQPPVKTTGKAIDGTK